LGRYFLFLLRNNSTPPTPTPSTKDKGSGMLTLPVPHPPPPPAKALETPRILVAIDIAAVCSKFRISIAPGGRF
jgi:hypothetical protein